MKPAVRQAAQAAKDVVVFKALANSVRLQIVSLVAAAPAGQVSAGHIVESFSLSQPTISHHLRVLREAGVLTTYKTSTFVYYRFAPQLIDTVTSVLPSQAASAPPTDERAASAARQSTPLKSAPAKSAPAKSAPENATAVKPKPEPKATVTKAAADKTKPKKSKAKGKAKRERQGSGKKK